MQVANSKQQVFLIPVIVDYLFKLDEHSAAFGKECQYAK
jgi:hypothetical protein